MISPLAYSPNSTALGRSGAGAATVFLGCLAAIAFTTSSPILLGGCLVAAIAAGLLAGASPAVWLALRWGAVLGVVIVAINAIASQRGDTLLIRGPDVPVLGTMDVSAEALAEGGLLALRFLIALVVFGVHSACVDPDRLLRLVRPIARRSAMTATLITRLVPLAASDYAGLREASAMRGPGTAPVGRSVAVRRLVGGSLERAVDVAATLELRGYGRGVPARAGAAARSATGASFAVCGVAALALVIVAMVGGVAGFEAYPVVSLDAGARTLLVAFALPLLAAAPFVLAGLRSWAARR